MKYTDYAVTFNEFPDEIALCINISNCPFQCSGCHSPELWKDIGMELTTLELSKLIDYNKGITCVGFMGGSPKEVNTLAQYVSIKYNLKVGWYTGYSYIPAYIDIKWFNYIKLGPYIKELGGLNSKNTNQKMFKYDSNYNEDSELSKGWKDITYKFWKQ